MTISEKHIDYITVKALKQGDIKAFEQLFNKYASRLHHYAMGYLGSKEISEKLGATMPDIRKMVALLIFKDCTSF